MLNAPVQVTLRPTVRRPSGIRDQFYFRLEIFFRQLRVCNFVAPSLTRGLVCNLLYNCFWALPEQSLLGRNPAELMALFYCLIWDSPNLECQVPVFISPRNRVAQLYPQALGSIFVTSYDSQGCGGGILTRPTRVKCSCISTSELYSALTKYTTVTRQRSSNNRVVFFLRVSKQRFANNIAADIVGVWVTTRNTPDTSDLEGLLY
jgi:hypothetical protein